MKKKLILLIVLITAINLTMKGQSAEEIYEKVSPAVVTIYAYSNNNKISQGSGVIFNQKGYVLSNYHIIKNADRIEIKNQGEVIKHNKIIEKNEKMDYIVLKLQRNKNFPPIQVGNSNKLNVGEKVYAIGSPMELENTITEGIISGLRSNYDETEHLIQISAPISHGSSGGAVVNSEGKLIGISTFQMVKGQNLNFAIPINEILEDKNSYLQQRIKKYSKNSGEKNIITKNIKLDKFFGKVYGRINLCKNCKVDVKTNINYYWFKNGNIKTTVGGYGELLLHGEYILYYRKSDNLYKKGKFKLGRKKGKFKTWYSNGQLYKVLNYTDGQKNGFQKVYFRGGQLKKKYNTKKNSIDGTYKEFYSNGQLKYYTEYKKGKKHGTRKYFDSSGTVSFIEKYKNGAKDGVCKYFNKQGQLKRSIEYTSGLIDGKYVRYSSDRDTMWNQHYVKDTPNGMSIIKLRWKKEKTPSKLSYSNVKYKNGYFTVIKGQKKGNKKYGEWRYYDPYLGYLKFEGNYKNNKRNGSWIKLSKKGDTITKATFHNGKLNGYLIYYDSTGKTIKKKVKYKRGYRHGYTKVNNVKIYKNSTKNLMKEKLDELPTELEMDLTSSKLFEDNKYIYCNISKRYNNGALNGDYHIIHESDTLIKGYFKDSLPHYDWIYYNKSGQKIKTYSFKNDKLHGKKILYDSLGDKRAQYNYENGLLNGLALKKLSEDSVRKFYYNNDEIVYKELHVNGKKIKHKSYPKFEMEEKINLKASIEYVNFTPDGKFIGVGTKLGYLYLINTEKGEIEEKIKAHSRNINHISFKPKAGLFDSKLIATASEDGYVKIWKQRNFELVKSYYYKDSSNKRKNNTAGVNFIEFLKSGEKVVFGGEGKKIKEINLSNDKENTIFKGKYFKTAIALNPVLKLFAIGSGYSTKLLYYDSTNVTNNCTQNLEYVNDVKFLDTNTILIWSQNGSVTKWDINTCERLEGIFATNSKGYNHISISKNKDIFVTGSYENAAKIWTSNKLRLVQKLRGHSDIVRAVSFHPEKNIIASGSYDNTLIIWSHKDKD